MQGTTPAAPQGTPADQQQVIAQPGAHPNPIWDDILFWTLVIIFGLVIPVCTYIWKPELLALALILDAALIAVSAVAYIVPMEAPKNVLNIKVIMVIYGALFLGLVIGTLPTFAQIVRFNFWDRVVPGGFTSVYAADPSVKIEEVSIDADSILTVTKPTPLPAGYLVQVRYLDVTGNPHFEVIEKGASLKLPAGTKDASARLMRGAIVTEWVKATIK